MVKTKTPLLSASASGSIMKRLTFSNRRPVKQARYQKAQKDYLNPAREKQRGYFQTVISWWHELTDEEQQEWHAIGKEDC